jgi:hypothetical protein
MMFSYSRDTALLGTSSCKKCGSKIQKGAKRLVVHSEYMGSPVKTYQCWPCGRGTLTEVIKNLRPFDMTCHCLSCADRYCQGVKVTDKTTEKVNEAFKELVGLALWPVNAKRLKEDEKAFGGTIAEQNGRRTEAKEGAHSSQRSACTRYSVKTTLEPSWRLSEPLERPWAWTGISSDNYSHMTNTYPEHEKLKGLPTQTVGDFLDWLMHMKNFTIARDATEDEQAEMDEMGDPVQELVPANIRIPDLLAEYFKIDQNKLEAEKTAMLESIRKAKPL